MKPIRKQEAVKAARKLGFEERPRKHIQFKLVHKGRTILTTAVPKGKGPFHVRDKFRKQLQLTEAQLADTIKCPFGPSQYREHLLEIGLIEEE